METLAAKIARDGRLSPFDATGWVHRLAQRLEETHNKGLVHGQVSAYCILLEGASPQSLATMVDVPRTPEVGYHSPERCANGQTSQIDDTWALAVTFFLSLTGQFPFAGQTDAEVRQRIFAGAPQLARLGFNDPTLQQIIDQVFAREPGRRISSVTAFKQALERWLQDPRLSSLPPLDDEDEDDQPTVMMASVSVGSTSQQAPPPAAGGPPRAAKQTLLGIAPPAAGQPVPLARPAAGAPAASSPAPLPPMPQPLGTPPAGTPGVPYAAQPPQPHQPPMQPPAQQANAMPFAPAPSTPYPQGVPQGQPPGQPQAVGTYQPGMGPGPVVSRAAPTIMAVRAPEAAPSGPSTGTMAILGVVWFIVTFGGAAALWVVLTR